MKKKTGLGLPKARKNEVSLVHNNPLFNSTTEVRTNPLFEPPKPVVIPSNYGANYADEDSAYGDEEPYGQNEQQNDGELHYQYPHNPEQIDYHHGHHHNHNHPHGDDGAGMTWYSVMESKVEVKLEDTSFDATDPQFSKQQLWSQPHNEVLKRELRRNRGDEKHAYPHSMVKTTPENRTSIYINKPRLSLPVRPTYEVKAEVSDGTTPGVRASFPLEHNRRRGREPTSKASRASKAPAFKCLMPGCDKLFADAFSLSEHCVQHAFDFKEFIKQSDEEYLKRNRTL